jgi:soluble lytic murein transglycosylase
LALAAGAYNAGEEAVARWVNNAKGVPLDVLIELIPYGETRVYIARVWSNLWRYQYLRGGAAALTPFALQVP